MLAPAVGVGDDPTSISTVISVGSGSLDPYLNGTGLVVTLGAMWVRTFGKSHSSELVVVSDSRLSGGGKVWDGCPKSGCHGPRRLHNVLFRGDRLRLPAAPACTNYG